MAVEPQDDTSVPDSNPRFLESLGQRIADRKHGATIHRARQRKDAREFMDQVERELKFGVSFRGFAPSEMVPSPEIVSPEERLEHLDSDDPSKTGCSFNEELLRSENGSSNPPPATLDRTIVDLIEAAEHQLAQELKEIEEIDPGSKFLRKDASESGPATKASIRALDKKIGRAIDAIRTAEWSTDRALAPGKLADRQPVARRRHRKHRRSRAGQSLNPKNTESIHWRDALGRKRDRLTHRRIPTKFDVGMWWMALSEKLKEERAHHHRMKGLP